ncbi:replication initiation protein [Siphonobacter sp. SORGH_AS_1065]|uniref:replication initiation protein n=1 Tax=Siphonobacter sp. SORGH_AS_1065 TaxID=3041795 RepID=UPI0027D81BB8|nr:replication initiation protein [Siphonobacter sp. SORGH_AS_1065]
MDHEKKSLVRISNTLNLTRQEFLAAEKHIVLVTLLHLKEKQGQGLEIDINDNRSLEVSFPASALKETNRNRIKAALDRITSRKIYFDESSPGRDYFGNMVPFILAEYTAQNGVAAKVNVHLNPRAKKLFLELSHGYSTLDLQAVLNMKSSYSIRMYELLMAKAYKEPWTVEVDELKNLLNIEPGSYKIFTLFETRILQFAQKELAEYCHIFLEWSIAAKNRKKITAITLTIKNTADVEKAELVEQTQSAINHVLSLPEEAAAAKVRAVAASTYNLTSDQVNWILATNDRVENFIRVDLIIHSMVAKNKAPKDLTKYMAKSLGLHKVKFSKY